MNEGNMENSSLELYETAYNLHYVEGNLNDACRIYKAIIDEFPDSNECGYAVIQLQKIQANDVSERIKTAHSSNIPAFIAVACTVACLILMIIALMSIKKANSKIEAVSMISQAMSIMYSGNSDEALEILGRVKTFTNGKMITPYLLSANIYMDMQKFSNARAEFEKYQKITGKTDSIFNKLTTIKTENGKNGQGEKIDSAKIQTTASSAEATFKPAQTEKSAAQISPVKQRPKIEKSKPARTIKKSANSDSISFF